MLDIAWSEYLLVAVLALVLLGPKELPVVLRTLGNWVAKVRKISETLQEQLHHLDPDHSLADEMLSIMPFEEQKIYRTYPLPYQLNFLTLMKLPQLNPPPEL